MIFDAISQYEPRYTVKRIPVRRFIWFQFAYEIRYDETAIYTTFSHSLAKSTCETMNMAYRVGFYDGISAASRNSKDSV